MSSQFSPSLSGNEKSEDFSRKKEVLTLDQVYEELERNPSLFPQGFGNWQGFIRAPEVAVLSQQDCIDLMSLYQTEKAHRYIQISGRKLDEQGLLSNVLSHYDPELVFLGKVFKTLFTIKHDRVSRSLRNIEEVSAILQPETDSSLREDDKISTDDRISKEVYDIKKAQTIEGAKSDQQKLADNLWFAPFKKIREGKAEKADYIRAGAYTIGALTLFYFGYKAVKRLFSNDEGKKKEGNWLGFFGKTTGVLALAGAAIALTRGLGKTMDDIKSWISGESIIEKAKEKGEKEAEKLEKYTQYKLWAGSIGEITEEQIYNLRDIPVETLLNRYAVSLDCRIPLGDLDVEHKGHEFEKAAYKVASYFKNEFEKKKIAQEHISSLTVEQARALLFGNGTDGLKNHTKAFGYAKGEKIIEGVEAADVVSLENMRAANIPFALAGKGLEISGSGIDHLRLYLGNMREQIRGLSLESRARLGKILKGYGMNTNVTATIDALIQGDEKMMQRVTEIFTKHGLDPRIAEFGSLIEEAKVFQDHTNRLGRLENLAQKVLTQKASHPEVKKLIEQFTDEFRDLTNLNEQFLTKTIEQTKFWKITNNRFWNTAKEAAEKQKQILQWEEKIFTLIKEGRFGDMRNVLIYSDAAKIRTVFLELSRARLRLSTYAQATTLSKAVASLKQFLKSTPKVVSGTLKVVGGVAQGVPLITVGGSFYNYLNTDGEFKDKQLYYDLIYAIPFIGPLKIAFTDGIYSADFNPKTGEVEGKFNWSAEGAFTTALGLTGAVLERKYLAPWKWGAFYKDSFKLVGKTAVFAGKTLVWTGKRLTPHVLDASGKLVRLGVQGSKAVMSKAPQLSQLSKSASRCLQQQILKICKQKAAAGFLKKLIPRIAAQKLKSMAIKRGALAAAGAVTGVGLVVSVGSILWGLYDAGILGKEMYDNYKHAEALRDDSSPVSSFELDPKSQQAIEDAMNQGTDELEAFRQLENAQVTIGREGMGKETWTFENGEMKDLKIEEK